MSCEPPKFFLFVRCQVCLDVLGLAADHVNAGSDYNVHVDDSRAATLPFAFCRPPKFPGSAGTRYDFSRVRMVGQVNRHRLDAVRPDQFRSLCLELGQLQDCKLGSSSTILSIPHCGTEPPRRLPTNSCRLGPSVPVPCQLVRNKQRLFNCALCNKRPALPRHCGEQAQRKGQDHELRTDAGTVGAKNEFKQAPQEPPDLRSDSARRHCPPHHEARGSRGELVLHAFLAAWR